MVREHTFGLPTSRVSRLLRPLRLKCSILAASSSTSRPTLQTACNLTHSVSSLADGSSLVVIPPPRRLRALHKLDRASRANIEVSKKLYDIRDAFRNIIQSVHMSPSISSTSTGVQLCGGRIPSLASLCAATIGVHMEEQIALAKTEREGDEIANDDELDVYDEFYEAVPGHYRKYTLVSHALSIIISTCPPNHTLLRILLEVTMSYSLRAESQTILSHLLELVLDPPANVAPASSITLPSQSHYLKDLHDRVAISGAVDSRAFARIFCLAVEALPVFARSQTWTCQATVRLARRLRSQDYESFIYMCHRLCEDIAASSYKAMDRRRHDPPQGDIDISDRLAKWLEAICERLISSQSTVDTVCDAPELRSIVELLDTAKTLGLHLATDHTAASKVIADAVLCLTVLCASFSPISLAPSHSTLLFTSILSDYQDADMDTFNPITSVALLPITKASDPSDLPLLVCTSKLIMERWANALQSEGFYLLELWLWSNILAHVESMCSDVGSYNDAAAFRSVLSAELDKLREEVVPKIEQAERMHFACGRSTLRVGQTPRKAASKTRGSEFRWEELVGCWIARTPLPVPSFRAPKRRYSRKERDAMEGREEVNALNELASKRPRISQTLLHPEAVSAISSPLVAGDVSPSLKTAPSRELGDVKQIRSPSEKRDLRMMRANRRSSGFTSILADADANRVVLHERETGLKVNAHRKVSLEIGHGDRPRSSSRSKVQASLDAEPSSDDLNLFAYRSSEW